MGPLAPDATHATSPGTTSRLAHAEIVYRRSRRQAFGHLARLWSSRIQRRNSQVTGVQSAL